MANMGRQDVPIWNAIEANNFKQALKLAEKRFSKNHTEYYEALVVYIKSRLPAASDNKALLQVLESLPKRQQTLSDLDAVELYDEALREVLPNSKEKWSEIIGELRWLCVKASPKNEEMALKCFKECLMQDDLEHARLIANNLEKAFPNNHSYIFWSVTVMYLYSICLKYPEKQRKIWGGLALGQISKLALTSRQANDTKRLPVKSIHSPQELLLLHRVLESSGKSEQRLEHLKDPCLGPDSDIAKGEWQLWRLRIKLAEDAGDWYDVFETTGALLKRSRTKDHSGLLSESRMSDWLVWEAYVHAATELSDHKNNSVVTAELEAHLDPACGLDKSWLRNATLAWVKFSFESLFPCLESSKRLESYGNGVQELSSETGKLSIIITYLQRYGGTNTAYNDLRPFAERLAMQEREKLVWILERNTICSGNVQANNETYAMTTSALSGQKFATVSDIIRAVNSYKLIFLLVISQPEFERAQSPRTKSHTEFICRICSVKCGLVCSGCLTRFSVKAMETYAHAISGDASITNKLLSTDRHPADDLCILSAMAIIKLSSGGKASAEKPLRQRKVRHLLQATILLECAWARSKSNFQMSLMLVRLYSYLGCGSLAMRAFHRLAPKQTQLDSLSFTLFDRISSTHPHPFSHTPDEAIQFRSPVEHLRKQQKLYKAADEQISKNMSSAFKHGSYNAICEFREFSETLHHSMSAAMSVVEIKRIDRIIRSEETLTALTDTHNILPPNPEVSQRSFADTNDYDTTPNFESTKAPRFEHLLQFLPGPSDFRTRLNLKTEKLIQILIPNSSSGLNEEVTQAWLKSQLDVVIGTNIGTHCHSGRSTSQDGLLTCSEDFLMLTFRDIALLMRSSLCEDFWTTPNFLEDLDNLNTSLSQKLEKQLAFIETMQDLVPALAPVLHTLYTSYDVGRTVVKFNHYLSRTKLRVHKTQLEANKRLIESANKLIKEVVYKCSVIKKGLDEGGWIDKTLDTILQADTEGSGVRDGAPSEIVAVLKSSIDENFREEWAGLVTESWRESVIGLSYLRE